MRRFSLSICAYDNLSQLLSVLHKNSGGTTLDGETYTPTMRAIWLGAGRFLQCPASCTTQEIRCILVALRNPSEPESTQKCNITSLQPIENKATLKSAPVSKPPAAPQGHGGARRRRAH